MDEKTVSTKPEVIGQPAQLARKLCKVMGELENLPKLGWNEFHQYWYVRESEVVNGIRLLLSRFNVFIYHEVESMDLDPTRNITRAWVKYSITDADTGFVREIRQLGFGHDKGEKGYYKALAGAHKYFLMKTFNVSSGDDPEEESRRQDDKPNGGNRNQKQGSQRPQNRPAIRGAANVVELKDRAIGESKREEFARVLEECHWTLKLASQVAQARFKKSRVSQLTHQEYQILVAAIMLHPNPDHAAVMADFDTYEARV